LFLPKTSLGEKRIAHVTFESFYSAEAGNFQSTGFYYIGKNYSHIEKLVKMFGRGYNSIRLENAKIDLLRSIDRESGIPEVIFCEAIYPVGDILAFCQFLGEHPVLKSVPFLLDGTCLTEKELKLFKKGWRPDEILSLDKHTEGELRKKIEFFCKMKRREGEVSMPNIEERQAIDYSAGMIFKRAFDIIVSFLALLLLSPLMLLIALLVKLESRGPVFYISKRAGKGYKIFNFYKYRTMQQGADKKVAELTHLNQYDAQLKGPVFFKINNDPRITRIGKILRNSSLDELPQLINVFLGDMSLVGNRPLPLYEAETLTTDNYAVRFMAPAGITGLWQIKKRGNKDMSVEERINMDIDYASKFNFATDFWIIANTPSALLQKENV
jgi:lipopolysaccharide/colanic/teichoic acid biosynthesis glycosyltransferase